MHTNNRASPILLAEGQDTCYPSPSHVLEHRGTFLVPKILSVCIDQDLTRRHRSNDWRKNKYRALPDPAHTTENSASYKRMITSANTWSSRPDETAWNTNERADFDTDYHLLGDTNILGVTRAITMVTAANRLRGEMATLLESLRQT